MSTPVDQQAPQRSGPGTTLAGLRPAYAGLCLLGDVVCVLLFSLGGHQSHEADSSQLVTLRIAWPFLVGLAVGWAVLVWRGWSARRVWPAGVAVLASSYVLGLLLRVATGYGISGGFPVVTLLFLAITMLGWRGFVAGKLRYRR